MFGKARDLNDTTHFDGPTIEDFFGDESAAAEVVRVNELHQRVTQVESQINSQFTSLATYAQIAQEQIELARAESKASTERSEQRLTQLIERERADRIDAMDGSNGVVSIGSARSAMDERLDALEHSVAQIKVTLDECFAQQLALADAISTLFTAGADRPASVLPAPAPTIGPDVLPAPTMVEQQRCAHCRHRRRPERACPASPAGTVRHGRHPRLVHRARHRLITRRAHIERTISERTSWCTRHRAGRQRTISIRMPLSSHVGSIGMRLIARPAARRAVNSRAPACIRWTSPAPSGGTLVITSSTPGRR